MNTNVQTLPDPKPKGYVKFMRGDALELIRANPLAFVLASVIAYRARYSAAFNADGLQPGDAMLGDFKNYGMSARQYRTAKQQLAKWGFATFRTTNKGTIGKLIGTRLFDPLNRAPDKRNDKRATGSRQSADNQPTPNKKGSNTDATPQENGGECPPASASQLSQSERISAEDYLKRVEGRIHQIKERAARNAMGEMMYDDDEKAEIKDLRAEQKKLKDKLGYKA